MTATAALHTGWHACLIDEPGASDAAGARLSGEALSRPSFDASGWRRAIVPGTVLTTLLQDRAWLEAHVPGQVLAHPRNRDTFDPFFHLNLKHLPDVGDRALPGERFRKGRGRDFYTCWYRLGFEVDTEQRHAERLWLRLRGINYTATVFLNGARLEGAPCRGMFRDRRFDVTDLAVRDGANALAILVGPLDHPGIGNGINGTDGEIARDVSMQYVAGWDWVPPIPDRDTGIWDRVELQGTGALVLRDPQVITRVPGERRPEGPQDPAELWVGVDVVNAGSEPAVACVRGSLVEPAGTAGTDSATTAAPDGAGPGAALDTATGAVGSGDADGPHADTPAAGGGADRRDGDSLAGQATEPPGDNETATTSGPCAIVQEVSLAPGERRRVTFAAAAFPQLRLANPRLWWPHGYGDQPLYLLHLAVDTVDREAEIGPSDATTVGFGIREIRSEVPEVPAGMGRVFRVNGRRVFVRGGNWVGTDALLRGDAARYRHEVGLHRAMNLNMIRIWGGAIAERPEFYDACDELGILVMQDFWITGDGNGAWEDPTKYPQPVRRRYPDDHELFLASARDTIRLLRNHPSLCFWCGGNEIAPWGYAAGETAPPADLNGALAEYIGEDTGSLDPTRVYVPSSADADYIGCDGDGLHGHGPYGYQEPEDYPPLAHGFTTEIGTAAVPVAESLRRMIDADDLFPDGQPGWNTAGWHFHNEQNQDTYGFAVRQYGPPADLDEFGLQAQLVNTKSYQGIFEAWNTRLWDTCSGLLIWKSQNCWPNLRSQIYDWYLEPTGGFFATRRACAPTVVQLDLATRRVGVCNTTADPLRGVHVTATWHDLSGRAHDGGERAVDVPADSYRAVFRARRPAGLSRVHFLELALLAADGTRLAGNVYWFSRKRATSPDRYADLQQLREAPVTLETSLQAETRNGRHRMHAHLHNPTDGIAFAVRLKLQRPDGSLVQPAFYEDSYLTLFAGQARTVDVECDVAVAGASPALHLTGWNVTPARLGGTPMP